MSTSIYVIFLLGFCAVLLLALYAFKRLGKGWSFQLLFKDFKRKIWMTMSLGGIFFSLYLLSVGLGAYFVQYWGTDLFFLLYQNPILGIYGGLWLFACLSLSIYLTRMVVKYFYLTRGKDS